jgi:hypothetical protein
LKAKTNNGTNKNKGNTNKPWNKPKDKTNKNGKRSDLKPPPAWMTTKPKDGESHTKMMAGKEYHWCKNHEAWTRHKPSECKGKGYKFTSKKDDTGSDKKRKPDDDSKDGDSKKKPKMVALSTMYKDDSSDAE